MEKVIKSGNRREGPRPGSQKPGQNYVMPVVRGIKKGSAAICVVMKKLPKK